MRDSPSIFTLLELLHGQVISQENGYWIKVEAWSVVPDRNVSHGIRYSLTLHEPYGKRILGYDNAHAVKPPKKFKYAGSRLPYDHKHWSISDKGVPYEFRNAYQLLAEVLSDENRALLQVIRQARPASISALAAITGRAPGNLSRTLKTMSNYGFVELKRENRYVRPVAKATEFRILV